MTIYTEKDLDFINEMTKEELIRIIKIISITSSAFILFISVRSLFVFYEMI